MIAAVLGVFMQSKGATSLIEIGESEVRFLIGYPHHGVPEVLYLRRVPLPSGAIKEGFVKDRDVVVAAIREAVKIDDEEIARKVDLSIVSLLLPPNGFKVYSCEKQTTVVSPSNLIDHVDVNNVLALVQKEAVPNGNEVVEIVPSVFFVDGGRLFATPPLTTVSSTLGVRAQVHTLPGSLVHSYRSLVEEAGIRTGRLVVSTSGAASLIHSYKDLPQGYFLIDMGKGSTKVALIGNSLPVNSVLFAYGGANVDREIASSLSLSEEEARFLKERYGYHEGTRKDSDVTLKSGKKANLDDLSKAIADSFLNFDKYIANSIATIQRDYGGSSGHLAPFPLIFIGGASSLIGIKSLLPRTIGNRKAIFLVPQVMGARDPALASMLGFVSSDGAYRHTHASGAVGVSSLSRLSRDA